MTDDETFGPELTTGWLPGGRLDRAFLLPHQLGGVDDPRNLVAVPRSFNRGALRRFGHELIALIAADAELDVDVEPLWIGDSLVPEALRFLVEGTDGDGRRVRRSATLTVPTDDPDCADAVPADGSQTARPPGEPRPASSSADPLEAVTVLAPPPAAPVGAPFDWPTVEARLGLALPTDFRALCDRYGHGGFLAGWRLDLLTPGHPTGWGDLLAGTIGDWLADDPACPHPPHPAPGGLLPFLTTELQYRAWWVTDGPPEGWPIAVEVAGEWFAFEGNATELVLATLLGEGPLAQGGDGAIPAPEFHPEPLPGEGAATTPSAPVLATIDADGETRLELDLGGVLGQPRDVALAAFLEAQGRIGRFGILRSEARRSHEVIVLRRRKAADMYAELVAAFVQERRGE